MWASESLKNDMPWVIWNILCTMLKQKSVTVAYYDDVNVDGTVSVSVAVVAVGGGGGLLLDELNKIFTLRACSLLLC